MERTIDGQERDGNLELAARRRGASARRLGAAVAVVLAALAQQAVAQERQDLVFCEKLKKTGESKGVEVRTVEQGCVGRERKIDLSAILGLINPTEPPPTQSLQCQVRQVNDFTNVSTQVDCLEGETVTGGGLTLSVEDRLQGELFEASQPSGNGWLCDAGIETDVALTCFAICCSLTE